MLSQTRPIPRSPDGDKKYAHGSLEVCDTKTGLLLSAVYADAEGTTGAEKIRQGLVKYHT